MRLYVNRWRYIHLHILNYMYVCSMYCIYISIYTYTYVLVYTHVTVHMCVQSQEKCPHLSTGNMHEDTCNKQRTCCNSRDLEKALSAWTYTTKHHAKKKKKKNHAMVKGMNQRYTETWLDVLWSENRIENEICGTMQFAENIFHKDTCIWGHK